MHAQINYGAGRYVSDESIADAEVPLSLELLDSSYVDIPLSNF
jgi:hypothetical protein